MTGAQDSELIKRLRRLDACAISDALDMLGHRGAALGLSALTTNRRIGGRAVTVQLGPADGRSSRRHLGTEAVDASDSECVLVIAHRGRTDVSGWGGLLSAGATQRGIAGVIVDGACRDIDESREMGLPIFARCTVPVTARGRIIEYDWNVPVEIAGIGVAPGDLVIADGSGVVFVPRERAAEVIALAETIAAKEARMMADVRAGKPVTSVMGSNYEHMLAEDEDAA
ncbi:MAG: dimethylmenaquinone methyltransferase [Alphaproteobacteria bacterium]|nr:dimethylmenaquinone methyltransferase [Alphaproteobacteria bacterium]